MQPAPILLYNDECGVCRSIASWVIKSAHRRASLASRANLAVEPIGADPDALRALNPALDIWDAYATIHLLLPDGSMKVGGEAVAAVLRALPNTRWFAGLFGVSLFGFRPFQAILNFAYAVLAGVRPLFGCESCGIPAPWLRPFVAAMKRVEALFGKRRHAGATRHFSPRGHAAKS